MNSLDLSQEIEIYRMKGYNLRTAQYTRKLPAGSSWFPVCRFHALKGAGFGP